MRGTLQGVINIVRFNWPFYALSVGAVFVLLIFIFLAGNTVFVTAAKITLAILALPILASLIVSLYVYDLSGFYNFDWLDDAGSSDPKRTVNINAGFDETSEILKHKFPSSELTVLDFYDPRRHTEPSIGRARRAYPPFAGTKAISIDLLPLPDGSIDVIFAIMSAHEIRDNRERAVFFKELERVVSNGGRVVVVEHLRDFANLLAYNVGAFHFHARAVWQETFDAAKLKIEREKKITPFVTAFFLTRNGT